MHQIITHFTDDDLYKFTMCCAVIDNYPRAMVKYEFTDRENTLYPSGFADELKRQVEALADLTISDDEIDFMKRRCWYIPLWFYSFLKGFRYDTSCVRIRQDEAGHLFVRYEGNWTNIILFEVKILAIISELYYIMTGKAKNFDMENFALRSRDKAARLIAGGCVYSDFGTRRRASFEAQNVSIGAMKSYDGPGEGKFIGTSNVYLAMKHDLLPIGTMAHEFMAAIGGMYGPQMANYIAMKSWASTFRGSLGTFLYDTFGWEIFSLNFSEDYANMFRGLRVDSGNDETELDKIIDKYRSLHIDPATKQVVFSNGLKIPQTLSLQKYAAGKCIPSFGIGTALTNDFPDCHPLNIVIKLIAAKITESWPFFNDTCKLSEDPAKHIGNPAVIRRFRETLHLPV